MHKHALFLPRPWSLNAANQLDADQPELRDAARAVLHQHADGRRALHSSHDGIGNDPWRIALVAIAAITSAPCPPACSTRP